MKKLFLFLSIALLLCGAGNASAYNFNITFTADNVVNMLTTDANGTVQDWTYLSESSWSDWTEAYTAQVSSNTPFSMIWEIRNSGAASSGNPGGFLAEIVNTDSDPIEFAHGSLLSSASWQVSLDSSTWTDATEWGKNGDSTIWNNGGGSPVNGISADAQWIWWETNFAETPDTVFVKVDIGEPVPEPGTIVLLGAGLLGLVGYRRKSRK